MLLHLLLALPCVAADPGMPADLQKEIARLEASADRSAEFRRLLAETDGLPRREAGLLPPNFLLYEPALNRMSYDPARLKKATEWEFQVAEARELARAAMALPISVLEAELAAYQREITFALELAFVDVEFSKAWVSRTKKAKADADALRALNDWARSHVPDAADSRPFKMPAEELDRLAFFAALLADGPETFYAGAERVLPLPADAVRLAELEDFFTLHSAELHALTPKPGQPYVMVSGRRYPTAVVKAAQTMAPLGGSDRVKEAIGPADRQAAELSKKLRRWLKWPEP